MNKSCVISALTIGTWECGWQGDNRRQLYSQKDDNKIFFKSFIYQRIIILSKNFVGFSPHLNQPARWSGLIQTWLEPRICEYHHQLHLPLLMGGTPGRHVMQRSHPNIPTPGPRSRDLSAPDILGPCQREENEEFPHFKFNATHRTC